MPDDQELIRPAHPDDSQGVWALAEAFATSFTPDHPAFDASWAKLTASPGTLLIVADSLADGIVGYLLATSHLSFHANGTVAWVEEITVDERHRRSGIGRRLMSHAEDWARTLDVAYLALATRRAGPFYLALGYQESAIFYKKTLR